MKLLNGLLWVANVLLGMAILVFAFQYLILFESKNHLEQVVLDAPGTGIRTPPPAQASYKHLANLGNPVTPITGPAAVAAGPNELERVARFVGGCPVPEEVAYLIVTSSGMGVNAYCGQEITSHGQPVSDLRGWKLVRLTRYGAFFTDGRRQIELRRDDAMGGTTAGGGPRRSGDGDGAPFDLSQSKSRRTASTESHESWLIDRTEIDWAYNNLETLMQDVQVSAYPSGGIKIDMAGTFASQRGFFDGDVIKTVNGMAVKDRADMVNIANNPQFRNAGAMIVVVERAGRPYTLDFRPDFQRGQR
ncbi:MAG: hypothetical protein HYY16_08985 [Planctomycetes bacterium]|nr:hypothetical protein [Planctomycetota bacterium]